MRTLLPVLLLFISTFATAQKIEEYYDYEWKLCEPEEARYYTLIEKTDSGWRRRDYFIHAKSLQMDGYYADKECKVSNGPFYYFHANGQLQMTGRIINGKYEGVWLSYYPGGMMRDSANYIHGNRIGQCMAWHSNGYMKDSAYYNEDGSGTGIAWFDNGNPSSAGRYNAGYKMNGKWQFFHKNGQLSALEVYKDGKLVSKEYYDEEGKPESDTTNKDRDAAFTGGTKAWQKYMLKQLWFPDQYKITNTDKAVVVLVFAIDEDGNVTDVELTAPFHPAFDDIALQMMSKAPKWNPAVSHNRKVKYWLKQAVTFQQ